MWTQRQRQGHECAQLLLCKEGPSHPPPPSTKNRKNVRLMQHGSAGGAKIPNRRPPQHPLLNARKHFVFMIFHHPPLRRRIYLFFAWLEGFSLLCSSLAHRRIVTAREWNKPKPNNNKRGASAALFQRRAIMHGSHLNSVSPLRLWSSAHFRESEE